jgi:hypothetical protein
MPNTKARVVGSGYTVFKYSGRPIAFCEGVEDSGQRAFSDLGQPYQFIHPIGATHPVEIATSRVLQGGTLILTLRELWYDAVWEQLKGLKGTYNIVDIFRRLAREPQYVTCQSIIKPPAKNGRPLGSDGKRIKNYHHCTVVDIQDGDTVTVGALAVTKAITVAYTHTTPGKKGSDPGTYNYERLYNSYR